MRNALLPPVSSHLYNFGMSMAPLAFIWTPKFSMMTTSKEMEASLFLINPSLAINQWQVINLYPLPLTTSHSSQCYQARGSLFQRFKWTFRPYK